MSKQASRLSKTLANKPLGLDSQLIHLGHERSQFLETAEPLYMTSGYTYRSAEEAAASFRGETDNYIYSRYANPSITVFEQRILALEGAEACLSTATGMAAGFASLACFLNAGDRVVAARELFYSCYYILHDLLPRFGIVTEFVDGADLHQWQQALSKPAAAVFLESPTNPTLTILDIRAIADLAHAAGAKLVVDNVLATPIFQRPLALGADVVFYSATKHIDGQGRALGGVVLSTSQFVEDHLRPFLRHTGPGLSPFNAWVMAKGMETLGLRVRAQSANAQSIAEWLEHHPSIAKVYYPGLTTHDGHELARHQMQGGFGTVLSFRLKDDREEAAFALLNRLQLILISNNFGDSKSLATHPATTTHSKLPLAERQRQGISDGFIRLSIGLETLADIESDLAQALG